MKKAFAVTLLLSLLAVSPAPMLAQLRSRRVGNPPPGAPTTPSQTPAPRSTPDKQSPGAPATSAEPIGEEVGEDDVVRVNTSLVTIPVSIMDRNGLYIPDLRKEDFRIFEDGTEQEVAYFGAVEQPFTVALLLDTSGSTEFKIEEIQDAAIAFVEQLRPEDSVMVIEFDDSIDVLTEPTGDRRQLRNAIGRARSGGGTRLYDAVDFAIQRLNRIKGRKAMVLFTDGVDTTSRKASYESNVQDAEELDAIVYPVQYDTYADRGMGGGWPPTSRGPSIIFPFPFPLPLPVPGGRRGGGIGGRGTSRGDYTRAAAYLRDMADKTGGRLHEADDVTYLERAFESIAEELRRQYSLGYYPKAQSSVAARRQIRVRVKRPNLVVRARDSYIYKPTGDNNNTGTTARDEQQRTTPEFRRAPFVNSSERRKDVFERR